LKIIDRQAERRLQFIVVDGFGSNEMTFCLFELPVAVQDDSGTQLLIVGKSKLEVGGNTNVSLQLHHSESSMELRDGYVSVAQEKKVTFPQLVAELVRNLPTFLNG